MLCDSAAALHGGRCTALLAGSLHWKTCVWGNPRVGLSTLEFDPQALRVQREPQGHVQPTQEPAQPPKGPPHVPPQLKVFVLLQRRLQLLLLPLAQRRRVLELLRGAHARDTEKCTSESSVGHGAHRIHPSPSRNIDLGLKALRIFGCIAPLTLTQQHPPHPHTPQPHAPTYLHCAAALAVPHRLDGLAVRGKAWARA